MVSVHRHSDIICGLHASANDRIICHGLRTQEKHVQICKTTYAEVKLNFFRTKRIKRGVWAMARDISYGLHALDIACSNNLSDISCGMRASTTFAIIDHVMLASDMSNMFNNVYQY